MIDVRELLDPLVKDAPPPPAYETLVRRANTRRRRRLVSVVAGCVLLFAAIVPAVLASTSSKSTTIQVAPRQASPPPIPDGWKPLTFGPIQFAVPADWPVYDDGRCVDHSFNSVYLGMGRQSGRTCSSTYSSLTVQLVGYVGSGDEFPTPIVVNGLQALTRQPDAVDNRPNRYSVVLPDQQVLMEIEFLSLRDAALADKIVGTIGAAAVPTPIPTFPFVEPVGKAGPPEFCAAVEEFRLSGLTDATTGTISPEALTYFELIRDTAPAEIRLPVETLVAWLQQGGPQPMPAEVGQAALQSTQDWAGRC